MLGTYNGDAGPVQVELKTDRKTGLWMRPGTSDQKMIREASLRDYSTINCKGHRCLDLGANVGGFILKAAQEGAVAYLGFEPEPYNYEVLKANFDKVSLEMKKDRVLVDGMAIRQAAVSDQDGEFDLTISPGSNSPCSASLTTRVSGDRHTVKVAVVSMKNVLEEFAPSLIKMDIEGAEYAVLKDPMPSHVKEMAIEFHGFTKKNRALMQEAIARLRAEGWHFVEEKSKKIFSIISLITVHVKR